MSPTTPRTVAARPQPGPMRRLGAAAATVAVTAGLIAAGAGTAAAAEPPTLDATVDGHTVTIRLIDPHSGAANALTTCYPVLVDIRDAVPLVPEIAAGQIPSLEEVRPALYWGPPVPGTTAATRDRTWQIADVPSGFYLAAGVCVSPRSGASDPVVSPVLVGSTLQLGSAAIGLGSVVLDTPGMIGVILDQLGVDTGSLGSTGSGSTGSGSGSAGSGHGGSAG